MRTVPAHVALAPSARRFLVLFGAIARAVAAPAALRAVPLFIAVSIASAIIFGGNGMRAADLVHSAHAAIGMRSALWAGWLVLVVPVARVILTHPASHYLRALPPPRIQFVASHAALLCVASAPFAALFFAGAGIASALAVLFASSACAALFVSRVEKPSERIAAAGMVALIIVGVPSSILAPAALVALAIGTGGAWDRAPIQRAFAREERERSRSIRSTIIGPKAIALAIAHLHFIARTDMAAVRRSVVAACIGGVAVALAAKNNGVRDTSELLELGLVVGALPLGIAGGGLAGPLLEAERKIRWLLAVTATSASTRARATVLATAFSGFLTGIAFGMTAALISDRAETSARSFLVLGGAFAGAAIGAIAAVWARRADHPLGVDGSSLVSSMVGTILATMLLAHLFGGWALIPLAVIAIALAAQSVRYVERPEGAPR